MKARSTLLTTALFALLMGSALRWSSPPASPAESVGRPAAPDSSRLRSAAAAGRSMASSYSRALDRERLEHLLEPTPVDAADAAAIAEQIVLRQLADGRDVKLEAAQWAALAGVVAHYQTVRQTYEASIAEVTPLEPGHAQVVIPAYSEIGDVLRLKMIAAMEASLGSDTAHDVLEKMGDVLEGYFAGFGVSSQTLDFAAQSNRPNDYLIVRTATYWNSANDGSDLTTRQESHWPDATDGSATRWQPFFALLAPPARTNRS